MWYIGFLGWINTKGLAVYFATEHKANFRGNAIAYEVNMKVRVDMKSPRVVWTDTNMRQYQ